MEDLKTYYSQKLAELVYLDSSITFQVGYDIITRYTVFVDRDEPEIEHKLILAGQLPDLTGLMIDITHTGVGDKCEHVTYFYTGDRHLSLESGELMSDETRRRFRYTPYVVKYI